MLDWNSFKNLVDVVYKSQVCIGNLDDRFVRMVRIKKGKLCSTHKELSAYLHEDYPIAVSDSDEYVYATVCHQFCELLVQEGRCSICDRYRSTLRSIYMKMHMVPIVL